MLESVRSFYLPEAGKQRHVGVVHVVLLLPGLPLELLLGEPGGGKENICTGVNASWQHDVASFISQVKFSGFVTTYIRSDSQAFLPLK
jgi:hypothetical protein